MNFHIYSVMVQTVLTFANGKSKSGVIATSLVVGAIVLVVSLIVDKVREKRGPKKKKKR